MTSHHESVSCDSCRKNNLRGLRYKCLICYDYDLCQTCYETGVSSSRHTINHPMQCIIARNDYELFYSGEPISSDQIQSLTCPLCGGLGFTEATLLDHVASDHINSDSDESSGVVCPICGIETNQLTYDFVTHLTMEHRRESTRDPIEQVTIRGRGGRCQARSSGPRGRRSQPHYSAIGGSAASMGSNRDSDPLVEILAQLSGVRRAGSSQSPASQLHQLQMQIQSSPSSTIRANNDREVRLMRRTFQPMNNQLNSSSTSTSTMVQLPGGPFSNSGGQYCGSQPFVLGDQGSLGAARAAVVSLGVRGPDGCGMDNMGMVNGSSTGLLSGQGPGQGADGSGNQSQYLLSRCLKPILLEAEQQQKEILKADRSLFVQELLSQIGFLEKNNTTNTINNSIK